MRASRASSRFIWYSGLVLSQRGAPAPTTSSASSARRARGSARERRLDLRERALIEEAPDRAQHDRARAQVAQPPRAVGLAPLKVTAGPREHAVRTDTTWQTPLMTRSPSQVPSQSTQAPSTGTGLHSTQTLPVTSWTSAAPSRLSMTLPRAWRARPARGAGRSPRVARRYVGHALSSLLDALDVLASARIDLDPLALVHEERTSS